MPAPGPGWKGIHKKQTMNNLLYTIAVILVVIWAIGFFAYSVGKLIHLLLVAAIVVLLLRVIRGPRD